MWTLEADLMDRPGEDMNLHAEAYSSSRNTSWAVGEKGGVARRWGCHVAHTLTRPRLICAAWVFHDPTHLSI
jgi:hypothetical protein